MPTATVPAASHLDTLLETYLGVLDHYTTLRAQLGGDFSRAYLALAQARFRAPPAAAHVGFGAVLADGGRRGRAARLVVEAAAAAASGTNGASKASAGADRDAAAAEIHWRTRTRAPEPAAASNEKERGEAGKGDEDEELQPLNPLRLFGFAAPSGLKETQAAFATAVDSAVQLVQVERRLSLLEGEIEREKERHRQKQKQEQDR